MPAVHWTCYRIVSLVRETTLVQVTACRRKDDKPLPGAMMAFGLLVVNRDVMLVALGRRYLSHLLRERRILIGLGLMWTVAFWVYMWSFYTDERPMITLESELWMTLPRPADASTALSQQRSPPAVPSQRSQRRFLVISNGQNTAAGWVLRWLQDGHILGLIATEELPTHLYEQFLFIYDINDRLTLAEGLAGCRHVPLEGFLGRVRPQEIRVLLGESGDDKPRLHVADEMECLVRVFETLYKDDHLRDIPVYMYVKESYNTDDKQHKLPNDTQTDLLYAKLLELVSKPYAGVRNLRIYFRTF